MKFWCENSPHKMHKVKKMNHTTNTLPHFLWAKTFQLLNHCHLKLWISSMFDVQTYVRWCAFNKNAQFKTKMLTLNILRVTTINLLFQFSLEHCIFDVMNVKRWRNPNDKRKIHSRIILLFWNYGLQLNWPTVRLIRKKHSKSCGINAFNCRFL